jgi:amidohydrolase
MSDTNTLTRAQALADQLIEWRRDFHMHPELGFEETRTSARVSRVLSELGYRVRTGVGRTGVVAEFGKSAPIVAIRADMDALPILEANPVPYASQSPGVMHACGHDAHTAIGLGAASLLAQTNFPGTVRFLFQPAEEMYDEQGVSGAPRMIEAGAMQNVDVILALHTDPSIPVGNISVEAGPYSAGVDTFYASVIGKGGHGAAPHKVVDPIYLSSYVILALNGIVSRRLHPFDSAVISLGSIHGGQVENVIPEKVDLIGTIRYMETSVQHQIHTEIERALSITRDLGGEYELKIDIGYPPMINDAAVVEKYRQVAGDLLGPGHVIPRKNEMGAEDFSFLSKIAPGAMFRLGARIEGDERKQHNARFDIDEGCLPVGAALLTESALRFLKAVKAT